jgi:hypothetical protein
MQPAAEQFVRTVELRAAAAAAMANDDAMIRTGAR